MNVYTQTDEQLAELNSRIVGLRARLNKAHVGGQLELHVGLLDMELLVWLAEQTVAALAQVKEARRGS